MYVLGKKNVYIYYITSVVVSNSINLKTDERTVVSSPFHSLLLFHKLKECTRKKNNERGR